MANQEVDVVIIGMGPGGEEVAGKLAEAGLTVVGVESELVGGECPDWGCVPSKMMIRGSTLVAETRRADPYAGLSTIEPDLTFVAKRIRAEATDSWDDTVAADRFEGKGGRLVRGSARLDGPGRVVVGDDTFVADRAVVVATGSAPVVPPIEGLSGIRHWTNREAISAEAAPESLVVLGSLQLGRRWRARGHVRRGRRLSTPQPLVGRRRFMPAGAVTQCCRARRGAVSVAVRTRRPLSAVKSRHFLPAGCQRTILGLYPRNWASGRDPHFRGGRYRT